MIKSFKKGTNSVFDYIDNLSFFDNEITFTDGLNIIIGSNGTGKSTLINILAHLFFAYENGYTSFIGLEDFPTLFKDYFNSEMVNDKVVHSGHPILFDNQYIPKFNKRPEAYKPMQVAELLNDSFEKASKSSGEKQQYDWGTIFVNRHKLNSFENDCIEFYHKANDVYKECFKKYFDWFTDGTDTTTCSDAVTILLDEPTAFLDIKNKFEYWENIMKVVDGGYQVIISTHDLIPFIDKSMLDVIDNIIETEKGYYQEVLSLINK